MDNDGLPTGHRTIINSGLSATMSFFFTPSKMHLGLLAIVHTSNSNNTNAHLHRNTFVTTHRNFLYIPQLLQTTLVGLFVRYFGVNCLKKGEKRIRPKEADSLRRYTCSEVCSNSTTIHTCKRGLITEPKRTLPKWETKASIIVCKI